MGEDPVSTPLGAGTGRWSPGRWRVRTKVIAVVLVPVLLALVLAALNVRNQLAERDALAQVAAGTRLTGTVATLIDQLQIERTETIAYVGADRRSDRTPLAFSTDRVDRAIGALRDAAPSVTDLDPGVRDRYAVAMVRLNGLEALRNTAVATRFPATSVVGGYTSLIEPLLTLSRDIAGAAGQTVVVRPATSLAALGRAKEQAEIQHALLLVGASAGSLTASDSEALRGAVAEQAAGTEEFEAGATATQVQAFDDTVTGPDVDRRVRILQTALLRDAAGQPLGVDALAWNQAAGTTREALRTVETGVLAQLQGTADQLVTQAGTAATIAVVLVVLGVLVAIVLAVVIAGSLVTPLRRLRYSALDVAESRLPASIKRLESGETEGDGPGGDPSSRVEPVPIHTEEEIGDVARAFDTVHREAVRLAGEQARLRANLNALFVNLSRRSQGLLERQLLLIDTLEGREEDPDVLANLFQLDHLATRMRRNGENLLVLGGSSPSRGVTAPIPLTDVVRAAVGEVEAYQRIAVRPVPSVLVLGACSDDLTHLLAELLDNATSYSPPETSVVVSASRAPDGGVVIEITDAGLGMDTDDLAEANAKLDRPVLLDSSVPRQMGLFVVGELARRHDIVARLLPGDDTGVTACVQVPEALLVRAARVLPAAQPEVAPVPPPSIPAPRPTSGPDAADPLTDRIPVQTVQGDEDEGSDEPIYRAMRSAWFLDHQEPRREDDHRDGSRSTGADVGFFDDATADAPVWQSTADEGWRAVAAREPGTAREHTGVGLPRRRRGEELVPGTAAPGADEVPQPRQTLDGHALRTRMGRFQAGLRRGRHEVDTDAFERTGVDADGPAVDDDHAGGAPVGHAGRDAGGHR